MHAQTVAIWTAVSGVIGTPASVRTGDDTRDAPGKRGSVVTRFAIDTRPSAIRSRKASSIRRIRPRLARPGELQTARASPATADAYDRAGSPPLRQPTP